MSDWEFAQTDSAEELALLRFFSMKKIQGSEEIDFTITIKEFCSPKSPSLKFFAQANKETNQAAIAYTPSGWGKTMLEALSACIREINRFPYEVPKSESTGA
jgi:hypothetical protein